MTIINIYIVIGLFILGLLIMAITNKVRKAAYAMEINEHVSKFGRPESVSFPDRKKKRKAK